MLFSYGVGGSKSIDRTQFEIKMKDQNLFQRSHYNITISLVGKSMWWKMDNFHVYFY